MKKQLTLILLASSALSGCVVAALPPPLGGPVIVEARPLAPAPRVEIVPVAPAVDFVWVAGYWNWAAGRYRWAPGYWSAPHHGHPEGRREERHEEHHEGWDRERGPEHRH